MNGVEFFKPESRRYRLLKIPPREMLDLLMSPRIEPDGAIRAMKITGLPEGCKIQAVVWDNFFSCFVVRLWHESWEEWGTQGPIPELELQVEEKRYRALSEEFKATMRSE